MPTRPSTDTPLGPTSLAQALARATLLTVLVALPGAGCLTIEPFDPGVVADTDAGSDGGDAGDSCEGKTCDDGNPCTADSCDPGTGSCLFTAKPNGGPCHGCGGVCLGGNCTFDPQTAGDECAEVGCDDGDPCTEDLCQPGCPCVHNPIPGCEACDVVCDDGEPCTVDSCDAGSGTCVFSAEPMNGEPCLSCGSVCESGECQASTAYLDCQAGCDDGDLCTVDSCGDGDCGCVHSPEPGCVSCEDLKDCDDGNPCTEEQCVDGTCEIIPFVEGTTCGICRFCDADAVCGAPTCTDAVDCFPELPGDGCYDVECISCVCTVVTKPSCGACGSDADCQTWFGGDSSCVEPLCISDKCYFKASGPAPNLCKFECLFDDQCDDGDGCTADSCDGGLCQHVAIPGCGAVAGCSSAGVVSAPIAATLPPGTEVKVAGTAGMDGLLGCAPGEICEGELVLQSGVASVVVGQAPFCDWGCSALGLTSPDCDPMFAGRDYWAWGTVQEPNFCLEPGGSVPAIAVGLNVEGWCMQTTKYGLTGSWLGYLDVATQGGGVSEFIPLAMELFSNEGGSWSASVFEEPPCAGCKVSVPSQEAVFEAFDGFVDLELAAIGPMEEDVTLLCQLDSASNFLTGECSTLNTSGEPVPLTVLVGFEVLAD